MEPHNFGAPNRDALSEMLKSLERYMAKQSPKTTMYNNGFQDFLEPSTIYCIYNGDGEFVHFRVQDDGTSTQISAEEYKSIVDQARGENK